MRLRSRDQQPSLVHTPIRKRTRSAIKSRSSSRSSDVSRVSSTSSKRARIAPEAANDSSKNSSIRLNDDNQRSTRSRGAPLVKGFSPKRGNRTLAKRPRPKTQKCSTPIPSPEPPKSPLTPEAPPIVQPLQELAPVADIQATNDDDELSSSNFSIIASKAETLDESCPVVQPESNNLHTAYDSSVYVEPEQTANVNYYQPRPEDYYDPYYFIKHIPPQDESQRSRAAVLPCKTRKTPDYTLVLDLDETLVHCSLTDMIDYEFTFPITFQDVQYEVFVKTRPHFREFLEKMSDFYEIIIFTASKKVYADKLISIIDPDKRLVRHRLFREHCICVQGNYVKDLSILGRDLTKTIIVDNSPQAFAYHLDNGIPIESWYHDQNDAELPTLEKYLTELALCDPDDIRPSLAQKYKMRDRLPPY